MGKMHILKVSQWKVVKTAIIKWSLCLLGLEFKPFLYRQRLYVLEVAFRGLTHGT